MASTSPDGLWSPDAGNNYNLTSDLATMQATTQAALTGVKSSATDLAARVSAAEALLTDTGWVEVPLSSGLTGTLRYRVKSGFVSFSGAISPSGLGVNTSVRVNETALPASARPIGVLPLVTATSASALPNQVGGTSGTLTASGLIYVRISSVFTGTLNLFATYPAG